MKNYIYYPRGLAFFFLTSVLSAQAATQEEQCKSFRPISSCSISDSRNRTGSSSSFGSEVFSNFSFFNCSENSVESFCNFLVLQVFTASQKPAELESWGKNPNRETFSYALTLLDSKYSSLDTKKSNSVSKSFFYKEVSKVCTPRIIEEKGKKQIDFLEWTNKITTELVTPFVRNCYTQLYQKISTLEEELAAAKIHAESTRTELTSVKTKLQEKEDALSTLQKKLETSQKKENEQLAENSRLQTSLKQAEEISSALTAGMNALTKQKEELQKKVGNSNPCYLSSSDLQPLLDSSNQPSSVQAADEESSGSCCTIS